MTSEITLRIILIQPPPGVDFALQKGRGNASQAVQKQRSANGDLTFELPVGVKDGPDFSGPFVQGPRGGRFVYIGSGTYAGQSDSCWSRRLKVPLTGIAEELLAPRTVLETRIRGTAKDGGPACATPKPFDGWHAGSAS